MMSSSYENPQPVPLPNSVADGYSRTDERTPVSTSTTPVLPPLDFDYNDGAAEGSEFDVSSDGDHAKTGDKMDDEMGDDNSSDHSNSRSSNPQQNRRMIMSRSGEHRADFGDGSSELKATRATKMYAFCAALNSCNLGYDIGVNTGAATLIRDTMELSDLQLEVFMGSLNLFAMVGALGSSKISDEMGRRGAFRAAAACFVFGVLVQASATSYTMLMFGRVFVGLGVGFGLAVDPVYISEISQAKHRGRLVTWSEIATNIGIVLGFASGLLFAKAPQDIAWRFMFALGAVLPLVVIYLATFIMPESPRWLVAKGRDAEAREVLKTIYPEGYDVSAIATEIRQTLEVEEAAERSAGWDALFFPTPAFSRMLMVGVGTAIAQQAVGIDAIQYFLIFIFEQSGINNRSEQTGILIALGLIKLVAIVLAGQLFDKRGRRPLFFVSLLGMSLALMLTSMAFVGGGKDHPGFAVFGLALYMAFFSVGMGPGAWLIPSEVFSTLIRAKAMSVATFMNRLTATIMASTFLTVANAMSWSGFFAMLSIVCLLVLAWMYVYLPETNGRALEDMSQYFAEITGDRSIVEAERLLYRDVDGEQGEGRGEEGGGGGDARRGGGGGRGRGSNGGGSTGNGGGEGYPNQPPYGQGGRPAKTPVREKPPPTDAHVVGTMA